MEQPKPGSPGHPSPPATIPTEDAGRGVMPIEEFTALASRLVSFSMFREAIGLYETAVKLYPENLALKINLARVRDMKRRADERVLAEFEDDIRARREQEDRLANHAAGLAFLHYRRGDLDRARELFEFARSHNVNSYVPNLFLGKIYVARGDLDRAVAALEDARRANPWSEEVQSLLGRLYLEKGDPQHGIHAVLDAFVLSGDPDLTAHASYNPQARELLRRLGYTDADLTALLQERQAKFNQLSERIDQRRRDREAGRASERFRSIIAALSKASRPDPEALALKRFTIFERVSEEDLRATAPGLRRLELKDGEFLFREADSTGQLYFLDKGEVKMLRSTPFGEVVLSRYAPGQVFGEMDFLDGKGNSADAVAIGDAQVLTLTRGDADRLFLVRKMLSVQFLAHFWRSLAVHIRTTNEKMKTFFLAESMAAERRLDEKQLAKSEKVIVDIDKKIALFRERGLNSDELSVLATLSAEERFGTNDLIFAEGDPGSKLYFVLDGRVRIGKTIPGVGEEALAILERGDFFGEMALVDEKPRSADARAHEGGATVLSIEKRVLDDILEHDLKSAEQFLTIVCRILCQRLRETNETIVKWRIMSGGF